ncbi:MAG: MATE family efflux transporter, partial [Gemmatimonadetes bacterium]|nr:MATE family efflux transporter [Gemmatimonadota bacterium]
MSRAEAEEAFEIAVPAMVTGGIRTVLRATDFFLISLALGDAAVAGIEFGFQYYFIGFGLALGISSGTISVVARAKGAGDDETANLAVQQSLWIALIICLPLTVVTWFWADKMVGLLTHDVRTIAYGGSYLRIVMLAVVCRFWSMIAARALQGVGDARTPMLVRLVTIPTNLVLDAVLIFGLGPFPRMGVAGAALGTAIANTLAALLFMGVMLSGSFPVRLDLSRPRWDGRLMREIMRVGFPLAGTQLLRTIGRFPFLFILASIGTPIVAAYAIGRRVVLLALMPAWGFATAASTLVGQSLGAEAHARATRY